MTMSGAVERVIAGKWIAGESISDAIRASRGLNGKGIKAIINCLGEQYRDRSMAEKTVAEYLRLVVDIKRANINADITMKPTQIGLAVNKNYFLKNYAKVVNFSRKRKIFVWLDMEGHEFVDDTIDIYMKLSKNGYTGICIQSYLKRSAKDLERLLKHKAVIRLVKGAHRSKGRDFYSDAGTTKNYFRLMQYMFTHGDIFTIASHDSGIIDRARLLNKKYKRNVTYAMLTGIRSTYASALAKAGENVSVYVTYGSQWKSYSYRRLKEVGNLKLVIRSLLGG